MKPVAINNNNNNIFTCWFPFFFHLLRWFLSFFYFLFLQWKICMHWQRYFKCCFLKFPAHLFGHCRAIELKPMQRQVPIEVTGNVCKSWSWVFWINPVLSDIPCRIHWDPLGTDTHSSCIIASCSFLVHFHFFNLILCMCFSIRMSSVREEIWWDEREFQVLWAPVSYRLTLETAPPGQFW